MMVPWTRREELCGCHGSRWGMWSSSGVTGVVSTVMKSSSCCVVGLKHCWRERGVDAGTCREGCGSGRGHGCLLWWLKRLLTFTVPGTSVLKPHLYDNNYYKEER